MSESMKNVASVWPLWPRRPNPKLVEKLIAEVNDLSARVHAHLIAAELQELLDRGAVVLTPKNVRRAHALLGPDQALRVAAATD